MARSGEPAASTAPASAGPSPAPRRAWATLLETPLWYLAGLLAVWSFGHTIMRASDLFWHLAAGRWLVETRQWPFVDPFSYTRAGQPWVHHEWASDVIFHGWTQLLGIDSLVYWKWLVLCAAFLVLLRVLHRLLGQLLPAFAVTVFAVAVGAPFFDIRPQLYSLLAVTILLWLALCARRPSFWLPLLFFAWVNLHAGFFFGLMALALILGLVGLELAAGKPRYPRQRRQPPPAPQTPQTRRRAWLRLAGLWLACVAACVVNPNGIHSITYPIKLVLERDSPSRSIAEWLPPFVPGGIRSPLFGVAIALFLAASLWSLLSREQRRLRHARAGILVGGLTLAMAMTSRRFIPLFAVCSTLVVGPSLCRLLAPLARWLAARPRLRILPPLLAATLGAFFLFSHTLSPRAFVCLASMDSFPVDTLNFVEANQLSGKVFAHYNYGGYIEQRTGGRMKVFIDGRAEMVFDQQVYRQYKAVSHGKPEAIEVIESSGADFYLWPRDQGEQVTEQLLRSGRWHKLYQDAVSIMLVRAGLSLPREPRPSPDSPWRDLSFGLALARRSPTEARAHLEKALREMPEFFPACYTLARLEAEFGPVEDARRMARSCYRSCPAADVLGELEAILARRSAAY